MLIQRIILSIFCSIGKSLNRSLVKRSSHAFLLNRKLLLKILHDNRNTEYGRKYNFKSISSLKDFKEKVPVTSYKDYEPYVKRMIYNYEKNLLTAYPLFYYNMSTGTSGKRKLIPYTVNSVKIYKKYIGVPCVLSRMHKGHKGKNLNNRILTLLTANPHVIDCNIECGGLSEKILSDARGIMKYLSTVPEEVAFEAGDSDTLYFQARFALMQEDLSYCFLTFITQFLQLIQYIEENQKIFINDIRNGTIDSSIKVTSDFRKKIMKKIHKNPKRALELEKIFEGGFKGIVPRIWKSFTGIDAIANGGFSPYYDKLKYYLSEQVHVNMIGYLASEGIFAFCPEPDSEDAIPAYDSCFFEFLPANERDYSKTVFLDELETGKEYRIIVTNQSGFYRYDMKDIIKVKAYKNGCPLICYSRREEQCFNVIGEKVTEQDIIESMKDTFDELNQNCVDFVSTVSDTSPISYDFYMEAEENKASIEQIETVLAEKLCKRCNILDILIGRKQLAKPRIFLLEKDSFKKYRDYINADKLNQFKQLHIISEKATVDFFKGMVKREEVFENANENNI